MLPVVDELSGVPIDEGRGPAAELRTSVEDGDRCATLGEQGAGAQAGETGADDDDVGEGGVTTGWSPQTHGRSGPRRRRNQRTLRPWNADDPAEHVVVGGLDPVEDAR